MIGHAVATAFGFVFLLGVGLGFLLALMLLGAIL
jgi:hypothetical protein